MARKDPYDPEEGIIDLFDIVDDPEASPEPEPRSNYFRPLMSESYMLLHMKLPNQVLLC